MKTINAAMILLSAVFLTACTTHYNGIQPLLPTAYMPYEKNATVTPLLLFGPLGGAFYASAKDKPIPQVDSLQPTLKWQGDVGVDSYDVIIYTGVPKKTDSESSYYNTPEKLQAKRFGWFVPGKQVYYREAIRETSHHLEEPLQSDAVYVWSVRTRTGTTNVSGWSTYDFRKGYKVVSTYAPGVEGNNWWWPFSTPKQ
jgi:hypothetical protein